MIEIVNIGFSIYLAIVLFGLILPVCILVWRDVLKGE